ncbi:hypothetical protein [Brevibacterium linens]|uniref:hypothetical protein n=1 Tax=Brevibacterium linens TaxID=1703 RepID=UPI003BF5944A
MSTDDNRVRAPAARTKTRVLASKQRPRKQDRRTVRIAARLSPVVLVIVGLLLPTLVEPHDFPTEGSYWYAFGGLLIVGIYLAVVQLIFVHADRSGSPPDDPHLRKRLTLRLNRTRSVAVGGGVALLAAITTLVPGNQLDAFLMWLTFTLILHVLSWILIDTTVFPEVVRPISETELLEAVLLIQSVHSQHDQQPLDANGSGDRQVATKGRP